MDSAHRLKQPFVPLLDTLLRPVVCGLLLGAVASAMPPQSGGAVDRADFVFVIDHSDSMGGEIDDVAMGLTDFALGLQLAGIDARFAVVLFGGIPEVRLDFTSDVAVLADTFARIDILSVALGQYEAGLEAIRMALGAAHVNFAPGLLTFRPGALKNIILVTDENSDLPRYASNRVSGQTTISPPSCDTGFPVDNPWQIEVDLTARALIEADAFINMLTRRFVRGTNAVECQYGNFSADQTSMGHFDRAATLAALEGRGQGRCLEAQVLRAGLVGRAFNIDLVFSSAFIQAFFDAKIDEAVNPCGALASRELTGGLGTPGPFGIPLLDLDQDPHQGMVVETMVGNPGRSESPACLLIGDAIDPPLPYLGFRLLVNPTFNAIPLVVPPGGLRIPWRVETGVDSCGRVYDMQVLLLQGTKVAASERLRLVIGD